jgi:hypothetical protein
VLCALTATVLAGRMHGPSRKASEGIDDVMMGCSEGIENLHEPEMGTEPTTFFNMYPFRPLFFNMYPKWPLLDLGLRD